MKQLFFGASAGRSGTMFLANLLNAEDGVLCVHEGKIREHETAGVQHLPFLTLENRMAYEYPEKRDEILERKRPESLLDQLVQEHGVFGDVAYNNSPFLEPLAKRFPAAKFLISVRDGREFVRSATVLSGEDPTPVGWYPDDKPLSEMERYISFGRLRPKQGSVEADVWEDWSAFQKNCWLWGETSRLIVEALDKISKDRVLVIDLRQFKESPVKTYAGVRKFLGLTSEMSQVSTELLTGRRVNRKTSYDLPAYEDWSKEMKSFFWDTNRDMMEYFNYV